MYNRRCGTLSAPETITLISFAIDGTTYQAEEGMTWAEWVESEYNTDGLYDVLSTNGSIVRTDKPFYMYLNSSVVYNVDTIVADATYKIG